MKKIVKIAAAAAALVAFSVPASASDQESTATVNISDLDPQRDAEEIERRLAQAARRVCGAPDSRTLTAYQNLQTCRSAAIESARRR